MGTLPSELRVLAADISARPRVYADANLPATLVAALRRDVHWDVLHVLEHEDLRRASDREHFRLAREFGRTLITLDHDFLDDRRFPPPQSPGVVVCTAPDEAGLLRLLKRLDQAVLRANADVPMPLSGRKIALVPGGDV